MKTRFTIIPVISCLAIAGCRGQTDPAADFKIVEFHGHTYIAYDGGSFDGGLVHDPDCACGWLNRPDRGGKKWK